MEQQWSLSWRSKLLETGLFAPTPVSVGRVSKSDVECVRVVRSAEPVRPASVGGSERVTVMHFSQQPSEVSTTLELGVGSGSDVLRIRLQGFIDVAELGERLESLLDRVRRETPSGLLCDLRPVTGYGPGVPALARDGLFLARRVGVEKVALVVNSAVVRTAAQLLARDLRLELRCFLGEPEALRWLG